MVVDPVVRADRDQLLQGVRSLAQEALAVFGLEEAELTLLEYKQNATFRVDTGVDSKRYLLRLCMPGRYDDAVLRSELLWLLSLRQAGVIVPDPVPARDGSLVPTLALPGVEPRAGVLFHWLPGRPLEGALTPALAERAGQALGRLHRHALEFQPPAGFERPRWTLARLIGDPEVFPGGRLPGGADALLSPRDLTFLEEAGRIVRAEIGLLKEGLESWGLIHTDLEPDNLIVDGGELRAIDFEHCGWGWYLYDVAASLLPMADKPGFPALRQAFLRGYQAQRPLPPGDEGKIDLFLVARCLFSLRLIFLEAWDHPALREEAVSLVPYMLGGIRRILAQRPVAGPAALSINQLMIRLRTLGIRLWAEGGALRFSAPKGALDGALKAELSARKAEILEFLLQASRGAAEAPPAIPRAPRDRPLPLSLPQQRLWLIDQLDPGTPAYNLPVSFRLEGRVDVRLFGRVLDEIVARHEVMRTTFSAGPGDDPIQLIAPFRSQALPLIDLRGLPSSAREAEAQRLAADDTVRGFDLAAGPLLRTTLVLLADSDAVLITNMHHIISDGWSGGIFVREVGVLYEAMGRGEPSPLPELPVQYADFAAWQRNWLQGEVLAAQIAYWKERLAGAPVLLELPTDRPRPPVQSHHGLGITIGLSRSLTDALKSFAQGEGATPFMVLLAGFAALLARFSGQETVVLGSPTAGRSRPELEGLIGFFVNMLVLRGDLGARTTFRELVAQVRRTTLEAFQHQDLSFEQLVEELASQRNLSYSPVFQVTFALQNAPGSALRMPGVVLRRLTGTRSATPFDLALSLEEGLHGLQGSLRARRDLFDESTIERLMGHFEVLLSSTLSAPDRPVRDLSLLGAAERQILSEWNDTGRVYRSGLCVHQQIEEQAALHPERIALVYEGEALSYAEMDGRANRLAWYLRSLGVGGVGGVGAEVVVGVHLERSLDLVIALQAILKAGGAYLPLDPDYPSERLGWMLEDSGAPLVLSDSRLAASNSGASAHWVMLDRIADELARLPATRPPFEGGPDNLAYVIFTSGSTGRPKGVMCHHRGLFNRLAWMAEAYPVEAEDRFLQKTPFSFDVSVWELFWPFMYGARLVVARPGGHQDSAYLVDTIESEGITTIHFVPSMLRVFLEESGLDRCASLRRVCASGEALPADLVASFFERLDAELINLYGPTEAAIDVSSWVCHPEGLRRGVPIGRPIANLSLHVLDAEWRQVPIGVPGELYIGGVGVARGYLGRPDLTAERFLAEEVSGESGSRLYKTGDLARWLPDGAIEYLGRIDHQVKIRGFRIELGEIESVLGEHEAVRDCVVVPRADRSGSPRLVAYVVTSAGGESQESALQEHLRGRLPGYMVPSSLVFLDHLPLNTNGKVDRKALPEPEETRSSGTSTAPRTPMEELVAGVWSEILGLERVGVTESFFELGGHSLLATRMMSRLRQLLRVQLPLRVLFEAPTVADLSRRIESSQWEGASGMDPVDRGKPLALSFAQERLWFLDQLEPGSARYSIPAVVRLNGRLELGALAAAFDEIVRRHETLRTTFAPGAEGPIQIIEPATPRALPLVDLLGLASSMREAEALRWAGEEIARPFNLMSGPLLRVTVLRVAAADHVVLVNMHHIISDGWSVGVLIRELATLYRAYAAGDPSPLPELPIQYADFASWQRDWLSGDVLTAQLSWWRQRLSGAPTVLDLPTDRPRPVLQGSRGGSSAVRLSKEQTAGLQALSRQEGTTLFMTLLGLFQVFLGRHVGSQDFLVGSPIANRHRAEVEPLIGFFVNTLVLRGDLTGEPSLRTLLGRVREAALGAYAHQDLPFERLVEELSPERDLGRTPLFQVMFALQNAPSSAIELPGLVLSDIPLAGNTAKFDLSLSLTEVNGALGGGFQFNADLFDVTTVDRFAERFQELVSSSLSAPDRPVRDLSLLGAAERQILSEWNDTGRVYRSGLCVHQQIEEQAALYPERIALVYEGEALSYAEMDGRANRLAWYLRNLGVGGVGGVGAEVVVGVHLERSLELVIALQAILKVGGAYLPLDPAYPLERLGWMLEDSRAPLVLSDSRLAASTSEGQAHWVMIDRIADELARLPATRPPFEGGPDNLAYVIFTSGSTGRPKGAANTHRGIVNRLLWMQQEYGLTSDDRILQKTPFSFDVSVWELFWPLMTGARLVMARPGGHQDPAYLVDVIEREGITTLHFVPSMMQIFLEQEDLHRCATLRQVMASGEALPLELARRFFARLGGNSKVELHNLYGPTEAAVDVTYHACVAGEERVPIGRPVSNTRVYVLSAEGQENPSGVLGELWLGGIQVGRGYLNRPALTAERFVPDPFGEPGARAYRTGDLARWLPNGELEYLGRLDHQVKIRGFRIELGEIEAALGREPTVREAVVLVRGEAEGRSLVAYVVGDAVGDAGFGEAETAVQLRTRLRAQLPEHMVPSGWVFLPSMPLSPNGKVDRNALSRIAPERSSSAPVSATPTEELLRGIWSGLLGLEQLGSDESFFELGGHSLMAARLISRVRNAFGVELPLRVVFEAPTVAQMARRIEAATAEGGGLERPPIRRIPREGSLPLSFAQERLWFLDQMEPQSPLYNMPAALRLTGCLDPAALGKCLCNILLRHEALRTRFPETGGAPTQRIADAAVLTLPIVDLSGLPAESCDGEARQLARADASRPFDLTQGPLIRASLLRREPESWTVLLNLHHIVGDGWSLGVLVAELAALYAGSALSELPVQYADYAVWQRQWLQGGVLQSQLSYWRRELDGVPPVLDLPTDRPRPAMQTFRGASRPLDLPASLVEALRAVSRRQEVTLFMTLLAGFQALLHRYGGQEDVLIGSPIAGRNQPELEGLIGLFVNTLALRGRFQEGVGRPGFGDLLERTRTAALGAYAHQELPFERLVEELRIERSLSHNPLIQAMLTLQNAPMAALQLPGLTLVAESPVGPRETVAKFDLTVSLVESEGRLLGTLDYATDLFDGTTAIRFGMHLLALLENAATQPERSLAELPLLAQSERHQLLAEWNDQASDPPEGAVVHQLFAEQARRTPTVTAAVFGDETCSYAELNARANRLAHHLGALGAGPGVPVAIYLDRSLDLVVATLAVLKAGSAYIPLDSSYPAERLTLMLEDSGAPVLITLERWLGLFPESGVRNVCLDRDQALLSEGDESDPVCSGGPESLAYVIYTSGSTGRPKGVAVPHRAITRLVRDANYIQLHADDVVAQASNTSFDASTFEIWGALLNGARLVGVTKDTMLSPPDLVEQIRRDGITVLFLTTALFNQVVREIPDAFRTLSSLLFGGEAVDPAIVRRTLESGPPERLLHVYGPTESTTFASWHLVDEVSMAATTVPIGGPLSNTTLLVLDGSLQPVPLGAVGELFIGGEGLAWGYLNRPDLTAARFVPDPWPLGAGSKAGGERLYRTGDLVKRRGDGAIEFLGRTDFQVKVRGFRIELGEIEAAILSFPEVRDAVVLVLGEGNDKRLAAYVTPRVSIAELRLFLARRLPEFMVPSGWVRLESLPLNPNGKVDRNALARIVPSTESAGGPATLLAPRTPMEELVAGVWSEVLGLERVGVTESFFELGGHSLLATRMMSRLRQLLQVQFPLRALFEAPTVAELSRRIEGTQWEGASGMEPADRGKPLALSFAQERLWFLDQLEPGSARYSIPAVVRLNGRLELGALAAAFDEIVRRHETLRTTFAPGAEGPIQIIEPATPRALPLVDLLGLASSMREAEALRWAGEEIARPFNLMSGPLLRVTVLRVAAADHVVLVNMHHIISDGWSVGVLIRELATLYRAYVAGDPLPLPELPIQYADFASWQRGWLSGDVLTAQLSWWRQRLSGAPTVLDLPTDRPRPVLQGSRGGSSAVRLSEEQTAGLQALSRQEGTTLFMTLLGLFQVFLGRHVGSQDFLVGSPIANRHRAEVEPLIGFFVNTLVLRGDLTGEPSLRTLLGRVREAALGAYAHQDLPFERLVEELSPERDLGRTPLFQVMFALQNAPSSAIELPGLVLSDVPLAGNTAKFDLSLTLTEVNGALGGGFQFNADLFDVTTVDRFAERFQELVLSSLSAPDRPVRDLSLLGAAERQILSEWNDTGRVYRSGLCVHQQIEEQAALHPERIALVYEGEALSYAEMDGRANRLAWYLRSLGVGGVGGVGAEVVVGVHLERSPELVIALQAILKAGGAYLPLDPDYPSERLGWMLEDGRAPLVLSDSRLAASASGGPAHWVMLDRIADELARLPATRPPFEGGPDNLAYVIFTSGSTGRPKGVMCHHRGLFNRLAWMAEAYPVEAEDRFLQKTPFSFDVSVWELFWPFMYGARLVVARPGGHQDSAYLVDTIESEGITTIHFVPSMLRVFLEENGLDRCASLRRVCASGEALPAELVASFFERLDAELINLYGPTEAAIDVSSWVCRPEGLRRGVPIGRPIANLSLHVLDAEWRQVPIGVPGELYIGGVGVARGYLGRPDLTAERFLAEEVSGESGSRLYKTGDLARWLPDGAIEYLGRIDHQVKIRGFRIELGEIESVLGEHEAVRDCVVVSRADRSGSPRLVAYVVTSAGGESQESALQEHLRGRLPSYMVPSSLVFLDHLPLNTNGKVDRKALPEPEDGNSSEDPGMPRDHIEMQLIQVWEELLARPVGIRDRFFDLGGHSLLALRLLAGIEKRLGVRLPVATFFQAPTVEGLADVLRRKVDDGPPGHLVPLRPQGHGRPLFWLHAAAGNVFCYARMAQVLRGENPVHGLQAPGFDGSEPALTSVEDLASHHLGILREAQPQGPYLLGGWSFGGLVAFEMARRLEDEGQEVALLALVDSLAPATVPSGVEEPHRTLLSDLATFGLDLGIPLNRLSGLGSMVFSQAEAASDRTEEELLAALWAEVRDTGLLPADLGFARLQDLFAVFRAHLKAQRSYRPASAWTGRATLFVATDRPSGESAPPESRWRELVLGGVEVVPVSGDHYCALREPSVRTITDWLQSWLGQHDPETNSLDAEGNSNP